MKIKSLVLWLSVFSSLFSEEPSAFFATWQGDPSTTMDIRWFEGGNIHQLYVRKKGENNWLRKIAHYQPLKYNGIAYVELADLEEDTTYEFHFSEGEKIYEFRTLPSSLDRTICCGIGGDLLFKEASFRKMGAAVAKSDPDFVIVGGDIAYTERRKNSWKNLRRERKKIEKWKHFFELWKETMIHEGRVIPLIPVAGNHDIRKRKKIDGLFYRIFAFPEKNISYRNFDIGKTISFFLLDSNHSHPIEKHQKDWLHWSLYSHQSYHYKIPIYHIAAYPSAKKANFNAPTPKKIRTHWVPLFEKYQVQVAFENHNHTYKRTYPLLKNRIDPSGVIYLGDGAWGVDPRPVKTSAFYLAEAKKINMIWLARFTGEKCFLEAVDIDGKVIDALTIVPSPSH
ncbi:MAG: metallophosphoesterase family protein [Chlamydiae bacterium]|nr:metallophosphoesterase family protein [Chlamydiota bacterium]